MCTQTARFDVNNASKYHKKILDFRTNGGEGGQDKEQA